MTKWSHKGFSTFYVEFQFIAILHRNLRCKTIIIATYNPHGFVIIAMRIIQNFTEIFNDFFFKVDIISIVDEWGELNSFWISDWQRLSNNARWTLLSCKSEKNLFSNLSDLFEMPLILLSSNAIVKRWFSYLSLRLS